MGTNDLEGEEPDQTVARAEDFDLSDFAEILPPEVKNDPRMVAVVRAVAASYSGPLPPPSMLRGYDDILPGAAHRILSMSESEQKHRQAMDRRFASLRVGGLAGGVAFAMTALLIAGFLAYNDKSLIALAIVLAEVAAIVAVFVLRRWVRQAD